jgi:hypothetical protein
MLAKTGLTVRDHQERTVENFVRLCQLWDGSQALYRPCDQRSCPFMPVLQGWTLADYFLRTSWPSGSADSVGFASSRY